MALATTLLVGLLALGLFLAARELVGFQPEPEWKDVAKLRVRLVSPLPQAPSHRDASSAEVRAYCSVLRREFRSAWRLCRFLAPIAGDPGYVGKLVWLNLRFQGIYMAAVACSLVCGSARCDHFVKHLRDLSGHMKFLALSILSNAELEGSFTAA
jgi:hypothetical protein